MLHRAEWVKTTQERKPDRLVQPDLLHDGIRYRGADQVGKLCRVLETGTLEIYRGDMLCMSFDVEERAKYSLSESKNGYGIIKRPYKPFSRKHVKSVESV